MRLFLLIALLMFNLEAKSLFSNSEQADTSKYIGALKDLVIATQKTRGLTNNYLNGNTTSLLLIYGNRKDMKRAIGVMESLPLASDPIVNNRATSISRALIKLNRKAFRKEPALVFEQYTEQIEEILMLAQTISKRSAKELNPVGQKLSAVMMETILPLCEYVGQMRGMGSGIATKGSITPMQNAQILAMIDEIETLSSKLISDIKVVASSHSGSFDSSINSKLDGIDKAARKYVALTTKELLQKKKINYDSSTYFDEGTALISKLIDVYNDCNKVIMSDSKGWL
jgi:methyl-accepting chemotaxis protein